MRIELPLRPLELGGVEVSVLRPDMQHQSKLEEREVREANPKDSGELLGELPGVSAVRRGPLGLDPSVRGLRETQVGVYIEGTRKFPAGPARMDSPLTHVDPSAISDVQVVKGPHALTRGAGNLNGVHHEMDNDGKPTAVPTPGRTRPFALGSDVCSADRDAVRTIRSAATRRTSGWTARTTASRSSSTSSAGPWTTTSPSSPPTSRSGSPSAPRRSTGT